MPVSLTVGDDEAVVRFAGLDALWALRRTARFPRAAVTSATVGPPPPPRGLRAPGTHLPGRVAAGTWRSRGGVELWGVHGDERALVVELDETAPFRRVVLELDDPDAVAAALPLRS